VHRTGIGAARVTADGYTTVATPAAGTDAAVRPDTDASGRARPPHEAFLAADVGGTHARIALVEPAPDAGTPEILAWRVYACADHAGLDAVVRAFCAEHGVAPHHLVLACAGYLHEGAVVNDNLAWPVVPEALADTLALDGIDVLNDFEALAHAVAHVDDADTIPLHDPGGHAVGTQGTMVVVGPGTGLGVAVRLPGARPCVLATEAGQVQLAARPGRERQVLEVLSRDEAHVPCERVLSGPGLLRLYRALCELERQPPRFAEPPAISAAACAGTDRLAVEALRMFCGWLGSFAGDLAMLYGATGGIYVAGGFVSRIAGFVRTSAFAERFLDKGVMRPFLRTVPVRVVDHGQLGVIGAARWLLDRRAHAPADGRAPP
jgi:glucokinase